MESALELSCHPNLSTSSLCRVYKIPEGPLLRNLYSLFLQLYLDLSSCRYKFEDDVSMDLWNNFFSVKLKFEDMSHLSDILFTEVQRRFELLICEVSFPSRASPSQSDQKGNKLIPFKDFVSLLRFSMVTLQLLVFDQSIVFEKCQILLTVLRKLCSLEFIMHLSSHELLVGKSILCSNKSVSFEFNYTLDGSVSCVCEEYDICMLFAEKVGSSIRLFCSMLEVFADELLVHHQLREHFVGTNRVSLTKDQSCMKEGGHSDIVLEVISAHFLLSIADNCGIKGFPETLFWSLNKNFKVPQLSVTGAMAMLGSYAVYSAPEVLQAHLFSLASECIGIQMPPNDKANPILFNSYLLAFELSINLYTRHTSFLRLGSCVKKQCIVDVVVGSTFNSFVQSDAYDKILGQLSKLIDPSHPCFQFSKKSDMLRSAVDYIKENHSIIDKSCRSEASLILNCIAEMALDADMGINVSLYQHEINWQELSLLAAGLRLMSSSLLQIVWFMKCNDIASGLMALKDLSECQEYDFMISIISCLKGYSANLPIQQILLGAMGTLENHKDTKIALVHFVGLLAFSFNVGLDYLWKSSIFIIMALMNFLIFEEGKLDAFLPLIDHKEKWLFPQYMSLDLQNSSRMIASNFEKVQMLYLQKKSHLTNDDGRLEVPDFRITCSEDARDGQETRDTGDTCDGRDFLQVLGMKSDYIDDMADFIVCKRGKDYSSWRKKFLRYQRLKGEKTKAGCRHETRKALGIVKKAHGKA